MQRFMNLAAVVTLLLANAAAAQDAEHIVLHETSLPLNGQPVDLAAYAPPGDGPMTIVVKGTVSCSIDGSQIDAYARKTESLNFEADGPFLLLPEGATVTKAQRDINKYTISIPKSAAMPIRFHPHSLTTRFMVTRSKLISSLSGALSVSVLGPAPVAGTEIPAKTSPSKKAGASVASIVGLSAVAVLLPLMGLLFLRSRKQDDLSELVARAARARQLIHQECKRLGPAFDDVAASGESIHDGIHALRSNIDDTHAALKRTEWTKSDAAEKKRDELRDRVKSATGQIGDLVERLEETAASLASQTAGQSAPKGIEDALNSLTDELDTALKSADEADAIG